MIMTKICTKCKKEKPKDCFSKQTKEKDGLYGQCKSCVSSYHKQYYENLKINQPEKYAIMEDRKKINMRIWRQRNPDKVRNTQKKWENTNREKRLERRRERRIINKDKIKQQYKEWYKRNIDRFNSEEHKAIHITNYLRCKLGITIDDKRTMYTSQEGKCAICHKEISFKKIVVDHCHKTGIVRGLLCRACNTLLGLIKEGKLLLSVKQYLDTNNFSFIHNRSKHEKVA